MESPPAKYSACLPQQAHKRKYCGIPGKTSKLGSIQLVKHRRQNEDTTEPHNFQGRRISVLFLLSRGNTNARSCVF